MTEKKSVPKYIVVVLVIAICSAAAAIAFYNESFPGHISENHESWGQFGDFFGGVLNPLFSFLSLTALLITIHLQGKELGLTREEMKQTTIALQGQEKALQFQNFNSTFFALMNLHNEIVGSLSVGTRGVIGTVSGAEVFTVLVDSMQARCKRDDRGVAVVRREVGVIFADTALRCRLSADHYYRNIYRMVKFVHECELDIDKQFYIGTLRAQLSPDELAAIFFNGLTSGGEKFKPLIEEYAFFDNISPSRVNRMGLIPLYKKEAYGEARVDWEREVQIAENSSSTTISVK